MAIRQYSVEKEKDNSQVQIVTTCVKFVQISWYTESIINKRQGRHMVSFRSNEKSFDRTILLYQFTKSDRSSLYRRLIITDSLFGF